MPNYSASNSDDSKLLTPSVRPSSNRLNERIQRHPQSWGIFTALAAIGFGLLFSLLWINGTTLTYADDLLIGGDLAQHYVAGLMWNENRSADLYRNFEFSRRFIQWRDSLPVKAKFGILPNSFNYVYSPFIARVAAAFTHWNFAVWIWVSLIGMMVSIVLAWVFLAKMGTGLVLKGYKDWGLLLSYPCLWFTLIPHQNSTFTFFFVAAASFLSTRGYSILAGLTLALVFYKPHFVIFIGLILLAAGRIRIFMGLASGSVLLLLLQLIACGWDLIWAWVQSMHMSLSGKQFQWLGLNQSWRGWVLSFLGPSNRLAALGSVIIPIVLCILAGLWLRQLEKSKHLRPEYLLFFAAAIWTVTSPYTAYYDFLMLLGLWAIACRGLRNTGANLLICFMGWIVSLFCASGASGFPWLTAPFVTAWIVMAIKQFNGREDYAASYPQVPIELR